MLGGIDRASDAAVKRRIWPNLTLRRSAALTISANYQIHTALTGMLQVIS
jgi:hypothetical protein